MDIKVYPGKLKGTVQVDGAQSPDLRISGGGPVCGAGNFGIQRYGSDDRVHDRTGREDPAHR